MRNRLALLLAVAAATATLPATAMSVNAPNLSSQWPCPDWGMYGRTLSRTFSTDCPSPITRTTVASLVPAWFFKTAKTVTASPVVVGNTVYVGDWSGTMYALNKATGAERWRFKTQAAPGADFGPIVSSAAVTEVGSRRLVVFGAGPRVYALDARTGRRIWANYLGATTPNGRPRLKQDPVQVESSPAVWRGVVYVGYDTHDRPASESAGARGGVAALDAATGATKWVFHPDLGDGCGGVWSSPTIDRKRGLVYFGSANCKAEPNRWTAYVEALTAVDAKNGKARWSFQPHQPNRRDWDFGSTPNLFVDAAGREVLGAGNKDGTYYAVSPDTGAKLWSTKVAEPGDVGEDFSVGGFIGSSSVLEGRVFGGTAVGGPPYFHAIEAETGAVMWRGAQAPSYAASAAVNRVVFSPALDGVIRAYDAQTGRVLWAAPLAGASSSGPAIVGDSVYVGSGTSSSDACQKDAPGSDACIAAFDEALGQTGGVHAFRLAVQAPTKGVGGRLYASQGNQLDVFDLGQEPPTWKPFIPQAAVGGRDLNGQICRLGPNHILLGEDSGQTKGVPQGWGVFDVRTRRQVGKLIARYPRRIETPEPHGCVVDHDSRGRVKRIFVSQVGSGDFQSADGQLIVFFPSSRALDAVFGRRTPAQVCPNGDCASLRASDSDYCELHVGIRAAGSMAMDRRGNLYVPEFAPVVPPAGAAPGRILRYRGPFPSSTRRCTLPQAETFIEDPRAATPGAIVAARNENGKPTGHWYVSSVIFPSAVNEYDANGSFVRTVLPPGFATPFGLAVDRRGTLYIADLGLNFDPTRIPDNPDRVGFDTADGEGAVLRVRFADGLPRPPEYLKDGLDFPDGVGLIQ